MPNVKDGLSTLEQIRPRSVGVEHAALATIRQLGFEQKLAELGFNPPQIAAALGNVIGRMAAPASELATYAWLQHRTALGELIGYDYQGMALQRLLSQRRQAAQTPRCLGVPSIRRRASLVQFRRDHYPV